MNKTVTVGKTTGELTHFLIEPFTPHNEDDEFYIAIKSFREYDTIYISNKGGIYVEENWQYVKETNVPFYSNIEEVNLNLPDFKDKTELIKEFVKKLYEVYVKVILLILK